MPRSTSGVALVPMISAGRVAGIQSLTSMRKALGVGAHMSMIRQMEAALPRPVVVGSVAKAAGLSAVGPSVAELFGKVGGPSLAAVESMTRLKASGLGAQMSMIRQMEAVLPRPVVVGSVAKAAGLSAVGPSLAELLGEGLDAGPWLRDSDSTSIGLEDDFERSDALTSSVLANLVFLVILVALVAAWLEEEHRIGDDLNHVNLVGAGFALLGFCRSAQVGRQYVLRPETAPDWIARVLYALLDRDDRQ